MEKTNKGDKLDKPIMQTQIYADGSKTSVVWNPFWGKKPTKENADEVRETHSYIEYIYYAKNSK